MNLLSWQPLRLAAAALGIALLVLLVAFAFGATSIRPTLASVVVAAAGALIAGAGILYAWREPER